MRKADLAVGDRVWIVLPYSGGRGWARILDLDAEARAGERKTTTVLVQFEPGHSAYSTRRVSPRDVVRKDDGAESNP